jgi:hypothetical protein
MEDECYGSSLSGGGVCVFPILMTRVVEGVVEGVTYYCGPNQIEQRIIRVHDDHTVPVPPVCLHETPAKIPM